MDANQYYINLAAKRTQNLEKQRRANKARAKAVEQAQQVLPKEPEKLEALQQIKENPKLVLRLREEDKASLEVLKLRDKILQ